MITLFIEYHLQKNNLQSLVFLYVYLSVMGAFFLIYIVAPNCWRGVTTISVKFVTYHFF